MRARPGGWRHHATAAVAAAGRCSGTRRRRAEEVNPSRFCHLRGSLQIGIAAFSCQAPRCGTLRQARTWCRCSSATVVREETQAGPSSNRGCCQALAARPHAPPAWPGWAQAQLMGSITQPRARHSLVPPALVERDSGSLYCPGSDQGPAPNSKSRTQGRHLAIQNVFWPANLFSRFCQTSAVRSVNSDGV